MDFPDSSLFTPDFAYEKDLDFSTLITPSTHISFQEPYPCNPVIRCAGIENDGRQKACETPMVTSEIREGDDEPKNKRAKHKELERQRRQEITSLFKNLRYLLPSQYTKVSTFYYSYLSSLLNPYTKKKILYKFCLKSTRFNFGLKYNIISKIQLKFLYRKSMN